MIYARGRKHYVWVWQDYLYAGRIATHVILRKIGEVDIRLNRSVHRYGYLAAAQWQWYIIVVAKKLTLHGELVVVGYHLVDMILRGVEL